MAVAALLFAAGPAKAQMNITGYTFTTGVGTASDWLTPASETRLLSSGSDDGVSSLTNLGFTFTFEGVAYTQISANTNGRLKLGSPVVTNQWGAPFNSGHYTVNNPQIIGIGADLSSGSAGGAWYGVVGSSPNRIGVVRFMLNNSSTSSGTNYLNWQVQLYEATGEIRIVYNTYVSIGNSFEIGVQGATNTNIVTVNPSTHTKIINNTYTSTTYSTWPGQYRWYSWIGQNPNCPNVSNLAYSTATNTLTWTAGGTETQWRVEYGSAGFTQGTGTTALVTTTPSLTLGSALAGGDYEFYVRPLCSASDSGLTTKLLLTIPCGGSGTQADPYLICNEAALRALATTVNGGNNCAGVYYRVSQNIVLTQPFTPIGTSYTYPFSGHFDGDGHTISNLTMDVTTSNLRGLFGVLKDADVQNVTISGTVTGNDTVGGIAGASLRSTIKNCVNNCTIANYSNARWHGGIVGAAHRSRIIGCTNNGVIQGAQSYHGGIVGFANLATTIRGCVNTGAIEGNASYHGGIVGHQLETATTFNDSVGFFGC
ncbi:MAG: hypothetical protein IJP95_02045, partial [Bacteroidales bacterium]|nr:hypothetical protein [Bacteroidales bacterium]